MAGCNGTEAFGDYQSLLPDSQSAAKVPSSSEVRSAEEPETLASSPSNEEPGNLNDPSPGMRAVGEVAWDTLHIAMALAGFAVLGPHWTVGEAPIHHSAD